MKRKFYGLLLTAVLFLSLVTGCNGSVDVTFDESGATITFGGSSSESSSDLDVSQTESVSLDSIPAYSGSPYVVINDNVPFFQKSEYTTVSYEQYAELDALGRCGAAVSSIGRDLMPTKERESIGSVKPTGWVTAKYDFVDGKYLYNRCHLIGYQLTAENANPKNLITGTRYLNVQGMLPFENMTADYIKETGNHVLYRVTPIFEGENLVADGVLMEGYSVEDEGEGVCFCAFIYNVQPGVLIDYRTGESKLDPSYYSSGSVDGEVTYVINTNTKKIHLPDCKSVTESSSSNLQETSASKKALTDQGYTPCQRCNP